MFQEEQEKLQSTLGDKDNNKDNDVNDVEFKIKKEERSLKEQRRDRSRER